MVYWAMVVLLGLCMMVFVYGLGEAVEWRMVQGYDRGSIVYWEFGMYGSVGICDGIDEVEVWGGAYELYTYCDGDGGIGIGESGSGVMGIWGRVGGVDNNSGNSGIGVNGYKDDKGA